MALFRVMQESLVNTQRHSGSLGATIVLDRTPQAVVLQISDQGRGIPVNGQRHLKGGCFVGGVGIQSMRERMKQVRGQLEIESSPNGTTVALLEVALEHFHPDETGRAGQQQLATHGAPPLAPAPTSSGSAAELRTGAPIA